MLFKIDASRSEAVYAQVMNEVKRRIARGLLKTGDRLPSVRELARTLLINPHTAARAYQLLEAEGVVATRQGHGTFVAATSTKFSTAAKRSLINNLLDNLFTEAYHLGLNQESLIRLIHERATGFRLAEHRERKR